MRKMTILLASLLLLLLAACTTNTPNAEEITPASPEDTPTAPTPDDEAPPAPTDRPDDYPGPEILPTSTLPAGYPEPEVFPTLTPKYPAAGDDSLVWIIRPLGMQCTEPSSYEYATVDEAVADLEDAGVEVFEAELINLAVCEACDCPTSEHFRAQIAAEDLAAAVSLGWESEPGG